MDSTALPPTRPNFSITAAKLIMVSQKDPAINGQVIRLTRPVLNIGRVEGDLVIADPSISRSHARLEYAAEQSSWTITDLNSKYGVKVNGRSIAPGQPNTLQAGMVVELSSNTRFEFQVE